MAKIIERSIESLIPDDKNFNKGTEYGEHLMDESLRKFGCGRSILIDKNDRIIAGNKTAQKAGELGLNNVIVVETDGNTLVAVKRKDIDLDTAKGRELALADNATSKANLAWDEDAIQEQADKWDFDPGDWGVDLSFEDVTPKAAQPELETGTIEVRCHPGDVWQLGEHRLMCGDSIDLEQVKKLMGGVKIDLLMTDPPYGINAEKMTLGTGKKNFHRGDWDSSRPTMTPYLELAKYACVWGGNYFADELPITNDWLCWFKCKHDLSFSEFELAWTNFHKNCRLLEHAWGGETKLHPTMKPLEVIKWALQQPKEECSTVLDVFGGSGTTLIACEQLGKKCYLMELDATFCDVILNRWEKETGKEAVLINT